MVADELGNLVFVGKTFNNAVVLEKDIHLVEVYQCTKNKFHRTTNFNSNVCPVCEYEFKEAVKKESIQETK